MDDIEDVIDAHIAEGDFGPANSACASTKFDDLLLHAVWESTVRDDQESSAPSGTRRDTMSTLSLSQRTDPVEVGDEVAAKVECEVFIFGGRADLDGEPVSRRVMRYLPTYQP